MADENNESSRSAQSNVYQEAKIDVIDAIASMESNRQNGKNKRKQFASIISIEDNEFVDVATNSYRIVQNALKRQKIEIVRVDNVHAIAEKLRLQIDDLEAALAVERNLVRILK